MRSLPRIGAAAISVALLLAGCASGVSKEQCMAADWRTVGYEDGVQGWPSDRIGVHRVACGKHQITPDLAAYLEGRERGLIEYCQPRNGYRVGLRGAGYANVCPTPTEAAFIDGYRYGRQIHDARSALRQSQAQLRGARESLAQTEAAMASVTAELVLPDVPSPRRAFLATELVRLTSGRAELLARIDQLAQRTQQLASSVQALERSSPYAL
jgi:outer membrane murein-binding lipoprotein Lpp